MTFNISIFKPLVFTCIALLGMQYDFDSPSSSTTRPNIPIEQTCDGQTVEFEQILSSLLTDTISAKERANIVAHIMSDYMSPSSYIACYPRPDSHTADYFDYGALPIFLNGLGKYSSISRFEITSCRMDKEGRFAFVSFRGV